MIGSEVFLRAQNLRQEFLHSQGTQTVFENLSFEIQSGEFVALVGPSGCGKSTLLRILAGLLNPTSGAISSRAQNPGFVFQEPRLLPWKTCLENTLLPLQLLGRTLTMESTENAKNTLGQVGLGTALDKFPHQLSGGMKMRNSLARSLVHSPDLLLLDEPFSALDEITRLRLQADLRELYEKNKWTVAFVTHSVEEACFLSDRIFIFGQNPQTLIFHQSELPSHRPARLRNELSFFEETRTVRGLFAQQEAQA